MAQRLLPGETEKSSRALRYSRADTGSCRPRGWYWHVAPSARTQPGIQVVSSLRPHRSGNIARATKAVKICSVVAKGKVTVIQRGREWIAFPGATTQYLVVPALRLLCDGPRRVICCIGCIRSHRNLPAEHVSRHL